MNVSRETVVHPVVELVETTKAPATTDVSADVSDVSAKMTLARHLNRWQANV